MPGDTDPDIAQNMAIIAERMTAARADIAEIKTSQKCSEARGRTFEKTYIAEHAKVTSAVEAAHRRLDLQDVKIAEIKTELFELTKTTRIALLELTRALQPIGQTMGIIKWIGGFVGTAIMALIIAVITGQVQLVFK